MTESETPQPRASTCLIAIEAIEVPEQWRTAREADVERLARSIEMDGLLQPIGVRSHPEAEGRYVLVHGRHRLEAVRRLERDRIEVTVLDVGEANAEHLTAAENLFRVEMPKAERVRALTEWSRRYQAGYPERHGPVAHARTRRRYGADAGEPDAGVPPTFVQHVAEATGMDRKTVEKYVHAGKNFNDEELAVLAECNVPVETIRRIGKLPEVQKQQAVSMIACGVDAREAYQAAQMPDDPAAEEAEAEETTVIKEDDMTGQEWVQTYCDEVLERLKSNDVRLAFTREAILYRTAFRDVRDYVRSKTKKAVEKAKSGGVFGPLIGLVARFINVDHPRNWLPCGACSGTGKTSRGGKCEHCYGNGYTVKTGGRIK